MSIRRLLTTALLVLTFTNAAFGQDKEYHGDGIDDAMRFVPLASAFVLKAAGIDGTSSWERLVINSAASVAISSGVTWGYVLRAMAWLPSRQPTVYAATGTIGTMWQQEPPLA